MVCSLILMQTIFSYCDNKNMKLEVCKLTCWKLAAWRHAVNKCAVIGHGFVHICFDTHQIIQPLLTLTLHYFLCVNFECW